MKIVTGLILSFMLWSCGGVQEPDAIDKIEINPLKEYLVEAVAQIRSRNYDSARVNLNLADSLSHVLQNEYARSSVLSNYGLMWFQQNQYDSAAGYYRQSLDIDLSLNDTTSIIKHSNDLGKSYRAMGYYGEATLSYERALKLALLVNDSSKIALCSNSLGNVLIELKDFEAAGVYYDIAIQYWAGLNQMKNYAIGLQNKATTLIKMNSVGPAIQLLKKSLLIKDTLSSPSSQAYTLNSLGDAYLKADSLVQAQSVLERALSLRKTLGNKASIAETELRMARLNTLKGDLSGARNRLKKIEQTAIDLAKPDLHRDVLEALKEVYWQQGSYYQHGLTDDQFDILNDSIYKEERLKVLQAQADSRLEAEIQKTALAEQNARLSSLEAESEKDRSTRRLQLIVVVLIALLVILWQLRLLAQRNKSLVVLNERIKLITDNAFHSQANALNLLSSLLRSKYRQMENEGEKSILDMVNQKVDALSLLTRQIFRTRQGDTKGLAEKIELSDYLTSLIHETVEAMPESDVALNIDFESAEVNPKMALNLGLVLNELITNTFKHAIPHGASQLHFCLRARKQELQFTYTDNGPGFRKNGLTGPEKSFGTKMINLLIEKDLKGKLGLVTSSQGTYYTIDLKI